MGRKLCKNMHKEIKLEVDGRVIDLPCLEGIIILNIMRLVRLLEYIRDRYHRGNINMYINNAADFAK